MTKAADKKRPLSLEQEAKARRAKLMDITTDKVGRKRGMWGDDSRLKMDTIPLSIPQFDAILDGGWRRGRIGMVVGEASMGKTLITQWTIKAFQERGLVCGFIDPEKTFDAEWFAKTGVKPEDLIVVRPSSTEEAFDLAGKWAENGMDLIVMDSLAALVPKYRAEHELSEKEVMGLGAHKISEGLAQFTNQNTDTFMLCTNQLRSKVGIVYGSPDEIPGGRAQKFYSTYILEVKRSEWITVDGTRTGKKEGYVLRVKTIKNKLAPPFQECEVPFLFTGVIDTLAGLLEMGVDLGILDNSTSGYYNWKGKKIHGKAQLRTFFEDNEADREELKMLIETNELPEGNEWVEVDMVTTGGVEEDFGGEI